jgi:hypothetical protein
MYANIRHVPQPARLSKELKMNRFKFSAYMAEFPALQAEQSARAEVRAEANF